MEPASLICKLLKDDSVKCLMCVKGKILLGEDKGKLDRYCALIGRKGDHCIFLYSSLRIPCLSVDDLKLEDIIKLNEKLDFKADLPKKSSANNDLQNQAKCKLTLVTDEKKVLLELPNDNSCQKFSLDLKRLHAAHNATASLGLPSSFSWLEKYYSQITQCNEKLSTSQDTKMDNPFAEDVFDPLKYMNISTPEDVNVKKSSDPLQTGPPEAPPQIETKGKPKRPPPPPPEVVQKFAEPPPYSATESKESNHMGFDDNFFADPLMNPALSTMKKAESIESLDNLDERKPSDNLSRIAQHLGLGGTGAELVEGIKPISGRENIVRYLMNEREDEFTHKKYLKVLCCSWNVNGQIPNGHLKDWLDCQSELPDIIAIGFQELDLSNQAYIFTESTKETEWLNAVKKSLPTDTLYRKVKCVRLVGVMLVVYIKEILAEDVEIVDSAYVATGIMGIMGNKGGVGVRFSIGNTNLCFVNSHLAAHQEEFERRNQDYRDITAKLKFRKFLPPLEIKDHDIVFWIGDLNYRISDLENNIVKSMIAKKNFQDLISYDQLHRLLGRSDVFDGFHEGEITFQPTYKYNTGTDDWDSSEKNRIPAWCDRILYKGDGIQQINYSYHPIMKLSDHKPVSALFDVTIKVIDNDKFKKVYEETMKQLDKLENEYLPQVTLNASEFIFKDVRFLEQQVQYLFIENTGQVPVTFEFIKKLDEQFHCKNWMDVYPYSAVIVPGHSCEISLKVYVDENSVAPLTCGPDQIEDILVLHLHGGKDIFITIGGSYIPSSFGSSIEALVQMHGPIREVPIGQLIEIEQVGSLQKRDVLSSGGRLYALPKEIWRLVDHIWKNGKTQKELFEQSWIQKELILIRNCLDTGCPQEIPGSIHSVAAALLLFLKCLPEPVIPYNVYGRCLDCSNNYMLCKQVIAQIPECHRNVFRYLCAFLRELLLHAQDNRMEIKFLATTFGKVFLRPPPYYQVSKELKGRSPSGLDSAEQELRRAAFVYHFLTNDFDE